ncbi:MAG TPA: hypothetical protein VFR17_02300 [Mycobacterium sp.]|nr:hypothetical protein [Mycobacterium sp.]
MLPLIAVIAMSAVLVGRDEMSEVTPHVAAPLPTQAAPVRVAHVTPVATTIAVPEAPAAQPGVAFDGLETRMRQATEQAAAVGAVISVAVLDRATRRLVTNGNASTIPTASVAKLFIADDLLMRAPQPQSAAEPVQPLAGTDPFQAQPPIGVPEPAGTAPQTVASGALSPADRAQLDAMLRSSDDGAAQTFWDRDGGNAIINRVAARYGLGATTPPYDGAWWNTITTAPDLVRYYDMLLDGAGGLPMDKANIILGDLAQSTPSGLDGYPQRFGIPEGLYGEPVAVKQGWMCCIGNKWMHLSTGVIGADRRYVMAIESMQPSDDATARATITRAVKTMFPDGRV